MAISVRIATIELALKPVEPAFDKLDSNAAKPVDSSKLLALILDYDKIDGWLKLEEAELLFEAALSVKSGCILEIGSYRGRATAALAAGSQCGAKGLVFAIEPHEHFAGGEGRMFGPNDRRAFLQTMLRTKLFGMVRLLNTTSDVAASGWKNPIALLFIDGDHRYEAVSSDFANWRPFLMEDALVIFCRASGLGPSQVIEALVEEGCLRAVASLGNLSILRFRAVRTEAKSNEITYVTAAPVYPAIIAKVIDDEFAQKISNIGRLVYYGGNGSYLYQPIPKCGCTSIKTTLLELENLPISPDEWTRHKKKLNGFPGTNNLSLEKQQAIFDGKTDTFKFVIVRDPYTRMASVYADKILNGYAKNARYWIKLIEAAAAEQNVRISKEITFEEFVRIASAQPIRKMDPHWRPQYYEGRFGFIKFDFVGHLEMLPSDLLYVLEKLKAPQDLIQKATRPHNATGASLAMWAKISPETRRAFIKTYAIDFDTLRYPLRSQNLERMHPLTWISKRSALELTGKLRHVLMRWEKRNLDL